MVLKGRQISHGAAYSDYSAMKEKAIYIGGEHLDGNTFVNRSTPDLEEIWLEFEREGSMYSKGGKDIKNTIIALEGSPTPKELKSLGINSTEETLSDEQKERLLELARQTLDTMDDMEISYNYKVKVKQKDANGNIIRDANGKPVTKDEIRQGKVPKTNLRNSKWFCMLHRDSKSGIWHFHFVISRFTKDGLDQNDPRLIAKRAARAAELVNQQRGWKSAERISTSHSAEIKDTVYDVLRKMDKFSWDDFKRDMEARTFTDYKGKQQNYELMFRNDSKGNVVGYSVWRGNSNYNASKIGKQLTASRLYKTWQAIHEDERKRATAKPKSQTVTPPKPKNIVYVKSEEEVAPSLNLQHVQVDGMEGIEAGTDADKRQISGRFVPFGSYHAVDERFADSTEREQGYGGNEHTGADDASIGREHTLLIVLNTTQHRVGNSFHHHCQVSRAQPGIVPCPGVLP